MVGNWEIPRIPGRLFLLFLVLIPISLSTSTAWGQKAITAASFGMQCGLDSSVTDCRPALDGVITLPTEPGTLRLWDSKVQWNNINYLADSLCLNPPCVQWTIFDEYLNAIANAQNISAVIYTFGYTPCWDITGCGGALDNSARPNPPSDLTSSGSPTFSAFVQALVTHCTTATHPNCVGNCPLGVSCNSANLIQYYELWNEANDPHYWTGTEAQLYEMVSPVISTIKSNVSGAQFLTPSVNDGRDDGIIIANTWMNSWISQEETGGLISTYYNFHVYLASSSPERQYFCAILPQPPSGCGTGTPNGILYPNFYPPSGTHAWQALPWINSETNFNTSLTCTGFNPADCAGQPTRWQALQASNLPSGPTGDSDEGAFNVSWYRWDATIGDYESGDAASTLPTDYYYGQQFLESGYFNGACTPTFYTTYVTVICPFLETNVNPNVQAYWVWTDTENGATCAVPPYDYSDYKMISNGGTVRLWGTRSSVACGVQPKLLEE
jgi:hypothetical protein